MRSKLERINQLQRNIWKFCQVFFHLKDDQIDFKSYLNSYLLNLNLIFVLTSEIQPSICLLQKMPLICCFICNVKYGTVHH
jgi:hypothetical protein